MLWKGLSERAAMATGNFVKLFGKADIPPLPSLATRLLTMFRDEDADVYELSKLITSDVGLSAKVLSTVNSSHYGMSNKVTSVRQAVALLGLRRVGSLATAFLVSEQLPAAAPGFDRIAFWQNAVQRSAFAENLSRLIAPGSEAEAFTGALLQDMALPILLGRWSTHYLPTVELAERTERPLVEVEDEQLSWNHAQAGAWMARNWGLPDVLVCCIGLHHATQDEIRAMEFEKTPIRAVAVSSLLPHAEAVCCEELGFSADQYTQLCQQTDEACDELSRLFHIAGPSALTPACPA
jgi:HD-like signal output (HDOD) protein